MYVPIFEEYFEMIENEKFREFAVEAVAIISDDYYSADDVAEIKATIANLQSICNVLDVDDVVRDMFTVIGLTYLSCKYDFLKESEDADPYHMFKVRALLTSLQSIVGREQYNNIMLLIESQGGLASPIPQVEPRVEDSVFSWILPIAIYLSRRDVTYGTA